MTKLINPICFSNIDKDSLRLCLTEKGEVITNLITPLPDNYMKPTDVCAIYFGVIYKGSKIK